MISFYLIGPINATIEGVFYPFHKNILVYWNTVPEWNSFSNFGVDYRLSFILFYSLIMLINFFVYKISKTRRGIYLPILIVFTYFTFFSKVLMTTVSIANLLVMEFILLFEKIKIKSVQR